MLKRLQATALLAALAALPAAAPPPTPAIDHVETMFGMSFPDPYHWMEAGAADFDAWLTAQGQYARTALDAIPGRAAILAQLRQLNSGETRVGGAIQVGDTWFYSKTRPEDAVAKLFIRPAGEPERILVDPAQFDEGSLAAGIDYWSVSPDGRHLAYGVSVGGLEIGVLRIRDVETGADSPERIDRTRFARPSWLDNDTFLYGRLPTVGSVGEHVFSGNQVRLHRLGADPATDPVVFARETVPTEEAAAELIFRGLASPNSDYVVGEYDFGLISSPHGIFVTPRSTLGPNAPWRRVAALDDEIRGVLIHKDMLYLRGARDAERQRILRTSAANPDLADAETILPEQDGTIGGMTGAADALYVQLDLGGVGRLVRIPWGGAPEELELPFAGAIIGINANENVPGMAVRMQGWTRSVTVFAYDPAQRRFIDTGIAPPSPVSYSDIEVREERAPAGDGVMIPVSIVTAKGVVPDGSHPVLLYVYGAYGVTMEPSFSPLRRAWFDRGGVLVVSHVRGGGGFGEDWHRAGRLGNKSNSVTDFIATAEYITRSGWAAPKGVGAMGGSAGGIVIGGAIAARPELFSAAIVEVGLLNALRLSQIPIGPFNTGEFGSTETEDGVRMLYAIDAYHQLRDGVAYPGVLIATARNDSRVSPWMPAKFAARLQAATAGPRPVLLRVDDFGGHSGSTRQQAEEDVADYYAFLLSQAGVPGFVVP